MTNKPQKVIVGMSGGVDSSVSALLLKEQGLDVEGLFMKNWEEDDTDEFCAASQDVEDAQQVCDLLGIKLHRVNFAAEYWDHVFDYFLSEYKAGRTPNPDILCNKEIKFKAFLEYAMNLGADSIATGHYAQRHEHAGCMQLRKGLDHNKDQSYFLYALGQHALKKSLFPIGHLDKPHVRELAKKAGLPTFNKKDSTGICFIGERKFKTFLEQYLPAQPGDMVTDTGQLIGRHQGLMYHTIGQRKGLGIGGLKEGGESPWYVLGKDMARNQLIVGQGHDHPKLFQPALIARQLSWIGNPPENNQSLFAKTRYRQGDQACRIQVIDENQLHLQFDTPQRAITPGQSVVLYEGNVCLGGGIIE
jgi:tRNA-uridine 2-sulfurtransferase